jgi:hypothetical protein
MMTTTSPVQVLSFHHPLSRMMPICPKLLCFLFWGVGALVRSQMLLPINLLQTHHQHVMKVAAVLADSQPS